MNNKYFIKNFKYKVKRLCNIPYATYLCVRFPFLYPRNRFTDKHYSNWKIEEKIKNIASKEEYKTIKFTDEFKPIRKPYTFKDNIAIKFYQTLHFILEVFHCLPTYTELDAMEKGWKKAFGIQICKELKRALKDNKILYKYRIMQIKEKWGCLHWYSSFTCDDVEDIIEKYEKISYHTCIVCGKPAHYLSSGWVCPYCEEHAPDGTKERERFYGYTKNRYKIKGEDKIYTYNELYGKEEDND